jgi:hypothetical protein
MVAELARRDDLRNKDLDQLEEIARAAWTDRGLGDSELFDVVGFEVFWNASALAIWNAAELDVLAQR